MAEQVTDKIEKTLQEVPYADKIRSYSKPGESLTILQLKDSSPPKEVAQQLVPGAQEASATCARTLPAGRGRAVLQRRVRRRLRLDLRAVGRRLHAPRSCAVFADRVRQQLLRVPDVAKVEIFGAQDEKIFIEISQKRLAQLGLDMNQVHRAARRAERGRRRRRAERRHREPAGARGRAVQLGRRAAGASRSAPSTRPPARPARCGWATSPTCGAATSTRRR